MMNDDDDDDDAIVTCTRKLAVKPAKSTTARPKNKIKIRKKK